jgi:hypothetical protein
MNAVHESTLRSARRGPFLLTAVVVAGFAVGWFFAPSGSTAPSYAYSLVPPVCFGAFCVLAVRSGAPGARWAPLLLLARFLLDIAGSPHIWVVSALGLAAGTVAAMASLSGRQRWALASTIACSVLLVATLVGGVALR